MLALVIFLHLTGFLALLQKEETCELLASYPSRVVGCTLIWSQANLYLHAIYDIYSIYYMIKFHYYSFKLNISNWSNIYMTVPYIKLMTKGRGMEPIQKE